LLLLNVNLGLYLTGRTQAGVFGNRVPRKAYEPKREKVKRDWRKLDEEELHILHSSSGDQMKVGGECDTRGGEGKCYYYYSMAQQSL